VVTIVLIDQLLWRPLLAWADKFRLDAVAGDDAPRSWFHDLLSRSWLVERLLTSVVAPLSESVDRFFHRRLSGRPAAPLEGGAETRPSPRVLAAAAVAGIALLYGAYRAA